MEGASEITLRAYNYEGQSATVKFDEEGFKILEDNRECKTGYLHIYDDLPTPDKISDKLLNVLLQYRYKKVDFLGENPPPLGATVLNKYFKHLSLEEMEKIGNDGKKAFYA
jgi:hypothetical protein